MAILGQFNNPFLPDDPNKREAAREGLLQFGASLLGGRGNLGGVLGQGLLAGSQGYQQSLQNQQQAALHAEQQKRWKMQNEQAELAAKRPGQIGSILQNVQLPGQKPMPVTASAQPPAQMSEAGMPQQQGGGVLPVSALPRVGQGGQQATTLPPVIRPAELHQFYLARGDALSNAGFVDEAQNEYKRAAQYQPKLKQQTALTRDGKRVMVNVMEDGTTQELEGFTPDMEKLHFANTGGETRGLDPYSGKTMQSYQNTQSADSRATDRRERERMAYDRQKDATTPKGQIVQTDEGPVLVDPRTGTGRVVTGPDGGRLAGVTKPLNDNQSKALLFGGRMFEADQKMRTLANKENGNTTTSNPWSRTPGVGPVVNYFSNENQQMLDQAKRDFMSAVLRRESGAAIADSEYDNADKQYFPQVGDDEKTITQKAKNRETAIKLILAEVPDVHRRKHLPEQPVTPQTGPYSNAEKERRYQEWKAKQGK